MEEKPAEQPKKKRPWFQIHLSTAVVMMVVVGILLINLDLVLNPTVFYLGFPIIDYPRIESSSGNVTRFALHLAPAACVITANIIFNISIVVVTVVGCERHIRRRTASEE